MARITWRTPDGVMREVHHFGCYAGHLVIGIDWLIYGRVCTYQCLLGLDQKCDCRCLGRYHGRLGVPTIALTPGDLDDWKQIGRFGYLEEGVREESGYGGDTTVSVVHCLDQESPRACPAWHPI